MMFKSQKCLTPGRKIRQLFWPSMGWRRTQRYWRHRIVRIKDSTYRISAGLAMGASISFIPVPGTHILCAVALSWIFRANIFAAIIGSLAGNPWTLPFMWWASHKVGQWAFLLTGLHVRRMPPHFFRHFEVKELVAELSHDPMRFFMPWFTGGIILMTIAWPICYFFFYGLITHLRSTHHLWKTTRLHKESRFITGQVR